MTEDEYNFLQTLGEFDTKTSSWIKTPQQLRTLGVRFFANADTEEYLPSTAEQIPITVHEAIAAH